jgi:hypothetical protein
MSTPNTHLLRIAEVETRLRTALLNGESTIRIRAELGQARRDHADASAVEQNAKAEAEARQASIIAEHAATIAEQVIDSINSRLAELAPPVGI